MTITARRTKTRDFNALIARAQSDAELCYPKTEQSQKLFEKAYENFSLQFSYPLFWFIYTSRFNRRWLDIARGRDILRR
jgi:hypothetical protein